MVAEWLGSCVCGTIVAGSNLALDFDFFFSSLTFLSLALSFFGSSERSESPSRNVGKFYRTVKLSKKNLHLFMTGIATKLKAAGYATHQVGKWHAGGATPDHIPTGRGFELC